MKLRIAKTSDVRRIAAASFATKNLKTEDSIENMNKKKCVIATRRFKTYAAATSFMRVAKGPGIYLYQEIIELPASWEVVIYSYYL